VQENSAGNLEIFTYPAMSQEIVIYTDGSSRGNPGPGGYGAILMYGDKRKELSAGYRRTTNNRMELMGVIAALEALKKPGLEIKIYTDSQYIVKAINEGWLNKWLATNFAKGIKNKDLWVKFYNLYKQHQIKFVWVKGHANNVYNNRCDELATTAADGRNLLVDEGYEMDANNLRL
jgi:ribonuclease HI